jgi:uncharacterized protein (TIGR02284 family)
MLQQNKKEDITGVLSDLMNIHIDRITGYSQTINNAKSIDPELRTILNDMISESENNKQQLITKIKEIDKSNTHAQISGKIYKAWKDLKVSIRSNIGKSIISSCEHNEDIVQHAYNTALDTQIEMSPDVRTLIAEQQNLLKKTNYQIRTCRNACHVFY